MTMPTLNDATSKAFTNEGYSEDEQALYVRFNGGALYRYTSFTAADYAEFKSADSMGTHLQRIIKPNFAFERVSE